MEPWVAYAHLIVTSVLALIIAFYGRKYGKTFEAAKKSEIDAKNAWIAKLEGELELLRGMTSENILKHTKAQKELLDNHIAVLEGQLHEIRNSLIAETNNSQAQQSKIVELESALKIKEIEIVNAREVASSPALEKGLLGWFTPHHHSTLLSSGAGLLEIMEKMEQDKEVSQGKG